MTQTPTGPATDGAGQLDEAYQRLHATGPEFDGWLSNHGPMGAEAIVRRGHTAELDGPAEAAAAGQAASTFARAVEHIER